jgi:hypothetical protein
MCVRDSLADFIDVADKIITAGQISDCDLSAFLNYINDDLKEFRKL